MKKSFFIIIFAFVVLVLVTTCNPFYRRTSKIPSPPPPLGATNVYFHESTGWQSWDYEYRFDAPPEICKNFAIELMKKQSFRDHPTIKTSEFKRFPVKSRFQAWFDIDSVKNGLLISADDWIYAVVDHDRGRLYYYNSH